MVTGIVTEPRTCIKCPSTPTIFRQILGSTLTVQVSLLLILSQTYPFSKETPAPVSTRKETDTFETSPVSNNR